MPKQILDFFPLQEVPVRPASPPKSQTALLKRVQEGLVPQKSVSEKNEKKDTRRPGEFYKRDRSSEELTDDSRAFYELAGKSTKMGTRVVCILKADWTTVARNAGMSLEMLVRSVFQVEVLLEKWSVAEKKEFASAPIDDAGSSADEDI